MRRPRHLHWPSTWQVEGSGRPFAEAVAVCVLEKKQRHLLKKTRPLSAAAAPTPSSCTSGRCLRAKPPAARRAPCPDPLPTSSCGLPARSNLLIPTDASLVPWQICRAHRLERAGSALVLLQDRDRSCLRRLRPCTLDRTVNGAVAGTPSGELCMTPTELTKCLSSAMLMMLRAMISKDDLVRSPSQNNRDRDQSPDRFSIVKYAENSSSRDNAAWPRRRWSGRRGRIPRR